MQQSAPSATRHPRTARVQPAQQRSGPAAFCWLRAAPPPPAAASTAGLAPVAVTRPPGGASAAGGLVAADALCTRDAADGNRIYAALPTVSPDSSALAPAAPCSSLGIPRDSCGGLCGGLALLDSGREVKVKGSWTAKRRVAPAVSSPEPAAAVPTPLGGRRGRGEGYRAVRWGGIAPSAAGTGAARGAARGVRGIGGAARAIETAGNGSATRTAGETAARAAANATESANGAAKARPTRSKRLCVLSLVEGSPHTQQRSLPHTRGRRNRVQCGTELRSLFPGQRTAKASTRTLSSHAAASIYATAVKPTADVDAPCV